MTHRTLLNPLLTAYLRSGVIEPDPLLTELRHKAAEAEGEIIQISPEQGAFLAALVRICKARRIVEIGTHWGYSALWLASAAGHGAIVDTVEVDITRAQQAEMAFNSHPFGTEIRLHKGTARAVLPTLQHRYYDLVFIDGEKKEYLEYLNLCTNLLTKGGVLIADNTLHKGRVATPALYKPSTGVIVEFNRCLLESRNWFTSVVPIGDGMTVAVRIT
ncbi:O-methyltransferase [Photobacterium sp. 53610]|uniref:O-methyltransferase n=1 Tax=Photobacterium sp. 53610 TaxID=3102789 RepID=UPI002ED7FB9D